MITASSSPIVTMEIISRHCQMPLGVGGRGPTRTARLRRSLRAYSAPVSRQMEQTPPHGLEGSRIMAGPGSKRGSSTWLPPHMRCGSLQGQPGPDWLSLKRLSSGLAGRGFNGRLVWGVQILTGLVGEGTLMSHTGIPPPPI